MAYNHMIFSHGNTELDQLTGLWRSSTSYCRWLRANSSTSEQMMGPLVRGGYRGNRGYQRPFGYGYYDIKEPFFSPPPEVWYEAYDPHNFDQPIPSRGRVTEPRVLRRRHPAEYYESRYEPIMPAQNKDGLPFTKAMKQLYKELGKAEEYYNLLLSDFDGEIEQIKKYATPDLITRLWINKVNGTTDKSVYSDDDEVPDSENGQQKWDDMKEKVLKALKNAALSSIRGGQSHKSAFRVEAAQRLQEKVEMACRQIEDLLNKAPGAKEHCKCLSGEINQLRNSVSPDNEANKDVYKSSGDGDEDGNDIGENDGGDGGGAWGNN